MNTSLLCLTLALALTALAVKIYLNFRLRRVKSEFALKVEEYKLAASEWEDECWDVLGTLFRLEQLVMDHLDFLEEGHPEIFRASSTIELIKQAGTSKMHKEMTARLQADPTLTASMLLDEAIAKLKSADK